jgi:hypothetical protein
LISQEEFEKAYDMRLNRGFSLATFIDINKNYNFEVIKIEQIDG